MKMKKRILSLFIAIATILNVLPAYGFIPALPVNAVSSIIGFSSDLTPQYGSNGESGNFLTPIEEPLEDSISISNRAELEAIADDLNANYHLTADIDLSGEEWIPIGDNSYMLAFTGTFDGQGYIISNMTITGEYKYAGLFGYAQKATIKNIGLEGTNINISTFSSYSTVYAGGICGFAVNSTIGNCYNTGDISSNSPDDYAGGICGYAANSIIGNCYNTGDVSSVSLSYHAYAGGICGYAANSIIGNCFNTGDVSSSSLSYHAYAGGICGSGATVSNSYNEGNVYSIGDYAYSGGICGSEGTVSNSYNAGDIFALGSNYGYSGGISGISKYVVNSYNIGYVSASADYLYATAYAGGIIGYSYSAYIFISNCYNAGNISAHNSNPNNYGNYYYAAYAGGICGFAVNSTIGNCYNTGNISSYSAVSYAFAGGICGYNSDISNCYNTGDVTASGISAYTGGILAYANIDTAISAGYWNIDNNQTVNSEPKIPKRGIGNSNDITTTASFTTEEMKLQDSFAGFDFDRIWIFIENENNGMPVLRMFYPCEVCRELFCPFNHIKCVACDEWDCEIIHVFCSVCDIWDCEIIHVFCCPCGIWDCEIIHVLCYICYTYDCENIHDKCYFCDGWECSCQSDAPCKVCNKYVCTIRHGRIRDDDTPIAIGDALQVLMYIARIPGSMLFTDARAKEASIIADISKTEPTIGDVLQILMYLAKIKTSKLWYIYNKN